MKVIYKRIETNEYVIDTESKKFKSFLNEADWNGEIDDLRDILEELDSTDFIVDFDCLEYGKDTSSEISEIK